ncbi:MAG: ATP-binding protein [Bacteroidales bacterium]|nr:ATP-binding protein [Bacteroidales bacterium]
MKKIVITGPECTGKSALTKELAETYNTIYIPEYARDFVEKLTRPYSYEDLIHIAETQVKQVQEYSERANRILFVDTFLIITKIWFQIKYNKYPIWLDKSIKEINIDLYLLCDTDIPWIADPVRENGGEMRKELFRLYKNQLDEFNCNYEIISGIGNERLKNAITVISSKIKI